MPIRGLLSFNNIDAITPAGNQSQRLLPVCSLHQFLGITLDSSLLIHAPRSVYTGRTSVDDQSLITKKLRQEHNGKEQLKEASIALFLRL